MQRADADVLSVPYMLPAAARSLAAALGKAADAIDGYAPRAGVGPEVRLTMGAAFMPGSYSLRSQKHILAGLR